MGKIDFKKWLSQLISLIQSVSLTPIYLPPSVSLNCETVQIYFGTLQKKHQRDFNFRTFANLFFFRLV